MCTHVNEIYSFHNLGEPDPESEGQRRKKQNRQQQRNNYCLENRPSLQASCRAKHWQAGGPGTAA